MTRRRGGNAVAVALASAAAVAQQKPAASCDRACLNALVDSYVAALVAHDPTRVPIAAMTQKFVTLRGVPGLDKLDMSFEAFDLPAAHIYKVSGGKMHEIEAMGFRADYRSKTGWE